MAIKLDFNKSPNQNKANNDRPQANVWLNIGFETVNASTGEVTFVSLPMGLPIDTMEVKPINGSNEEFRQLMAAKNALLEHLQRAGEDMKPGSEEIVDGLQIQLRRRSVHAEPAAEGNPFMGGIANLGFHKPSKDDKSSAA